MKQTGSALQFALPCFFVIQFSIRPIKDLKDCSKAHRGWIYLLKNTVKQYYCKILAITVFCTFENVKIYIYMLRLLLDTFVHNSWQWFWYQWLGYMSLACSSQCLHFVVYQRVWMCIHITNPFQAFKTRAIPAAHLTCTSHCAVNHNCYESNPNTVTNQQQTGAQLIEWENLVQNIVCLGSQLKTEAAAGRENEGETKKRKTE